MRQFNFFSPGLVDYFERVGSAHAAQPTWTRLWHRAAAELPAVLGGLAVGAHLEVSRTESRPRFNRYRTIDEDALERPVETLVLTLPEEVLATRGDGPLEIDGPVTCRLFDHGVFVVEGHVRSADPLPEEASLVGDHLDRAQEQVTRLVGTLAAEVHARFLVPLVEAVRAMDPDRDVVLGSGSRVARTTEEHGCVLWVTRGLLLDSRTPGAHAAASHWVRHVVNGDEALQSAFAGPGPGHVVRWFNHLFVRHDDAQVAASTSLYADVWTAMRHGQYFWAALEELDRELTSLLAHSVSPSSTASMRSMREALEASSHRAQFALIDLTEVLKSLTRGVHTELRDLLQFWEFDDVVRASVQTKVEACDRRLSEISEARASRSDLFTDLILLSIGITSILGTTLAVTEFGRVMAGDPDMAGFDPGDGGLTTWLAAQPADFLIMSSGIVSLALVLVYLYFRRARNL